MSEQEQQEFRLPFSTQAILFDLDDTLHHRSKAFQGWATAFAQSYCPAEQARCKELIAYLVELDDHGYAPRENFFSQVQHTYPFVKGSVKDLIAAYHRDVIEHVVLEREVAALIEGLQRTHIPFGIVTNGIAKQQRRKITQLGFEQSTPCIFISEEFGVRKPDPSIFRAAAQCLDAQPERVLFVGDHPRFDIWGARQVGMKTVWVQHSPRVWPEDVPYESANLTVHSFAELLPLFGLAEERNCA